MTHDEQDEIIFSIDKHLRDIEELLLFVESNPDILEIEEYSQRHKLHKAALRNITTDLFLL